MNERILGYVHVKRQDVFHRKSAQTANAEESESSDDEDSQTVSVQRLKRRASQARHRESVASCHRKLRSVVPLQGGAEKKKSNSTKSSINKANLLKYAKDYILHLENRLSATIERTNNENHNKDNEESLLTSEMLKFKSLKDFQQHFAKKFNPDNSWHKYFDCKSTVAYPNFKDDAFQWNPTSSSECNVTNRNPVAQSPSASEDLGFVSASNSQQSQENEKRVNTPKAPEVLHVSTLRTTKNEKRVNAPKVPEVLSVSTLRTTKNEKRVNTPKVPEVLSVSTVPTTKVKLHSQVQEYYVIPGSMVTGTANYGFTETCQYVMSLEQKPVSYPRGKCLDIIQAIPGPVNQSINNQNNVVQPIYLHL